MPLLGCTVITGPDGTQEWYHGPDLVHRVCPDGTHVERRLALGYEPPFLELVPCPYCEADVRAGQKHDRLRHVDTHRRTILVAPPSRRPKKRGGEEPKPSEEHRPTYTFHAEDRVYRCSCGSLDRNLHFRGPLYLGCDDCAPEEDRASLEGFALDLGPPPAPLLRRAERFYFATSDFVTVRKMAVAWGKLP